MNERRTAFMRLRWPRPCALNHSSTSVSTRKWIEDLLGGMTTRAFSQKSSSSSNVGASGLVLVSPRALISFNSAREYLLVSSSAFAIFTYLPPADNSHD